MLVLIVVTAVSSLHSQQPQFPVGATAYTTAPLSMRTQPRPTARLVTELATATALQVKACSKGWCSVKAGESAGHVLSEYLSLDRPITPKPSTDGVVLASVVVIGLLALMILFLRQRRVATRLRQLQDSLQHARDEERERSNELRDIRDRFKDVLDVEVERQRVLGEVKTAEGSLRDSQARLDQLITQINTLQKEFQSLDEEANLRSFAFYKPRYDFADSERYEKELDRIRDNQKVMLQGKTAAVCPAQWTVNGSILEGRKQTNHTLKLILRAFNGESDAAVAKVKYSNVQVMEARIRKSWEALNKLVDVQQCRIVDGYLDLKLQELFLAHEYQEKLQKEKEEQRLIREKMREEELARREIEKARHDAELEEAQYQEALVKAREEAERAVGEKQQKLTAKVQELEKRLAEAQTNKERAIARAQMTRSGHVYVISNVGSFGERVYKIGMTRRLDPMERVYELGDASVPFEFDVHAVIYSDDAPTLENTLHREFEERRINLVNARKEFFGVSIDEIASAVKKCHGEIQLTLAAEAKEYRQTIALLADRRRAGAKNNSEVAQIPSVSKGLWQKRLYSAAIGGALGLQEVGKRAGVTSSFESSRSP